MISKFEKYVGQKINRLTILATKREIGAGFKTQFKCRCDCGKEYLADAYCVIKEKIKSCGCYNLDNLKKERGHSGLVRIYNQYKGNARNRNIKFELTLEQFKNIISQKCHYCGSEPNSVGQGNYREISENSTEHSKFIYSGIDRVDSNLGYSLDNIVPCCKKCNLGKHEMTQEEFRSWIIDLYRNYITKN